MGLKLVLAEGVIAVAVTTVLGFECRVIQRVVGIVLTEMFRVITLELLRERLLGNQPRSGVRVGGDSLVVALDLLVVPLPLALAAGGAAEQRQLLEDTALASEVVPGSVALDTQEQLQRVDARPLVRGVFADHLRSEVRRVEVDSAGDRQRRGPVSKSGEQN